MTDTERIAALEHALKTLVGEVTAVYCAGPASPEADAVLHKVYREARRLGVILPKS